MPRKSVPNGHLHEISDTTDQFSQWFARFLKSIDADGQRTSFHSFRDNFRDALREGDVRHEIAMLLGGWSNRSSPRASQSFYGQGHSMSAVAEELGKVQYCFFKR